MQRRTSTEISGLILLLLKDGPQKKTWIKKRLKIDNRTLTRCLDTLAKHRLLTISDEYIEITAKGLRFTEIYKEFIQLLDKTDDGTGMRRRKKEKKERVS
ncbi:MAG: winged helix-turn-helix domain-containing protein [Candidatus Nitrosocaldus sp.]|nr:winged helix-turn-helix domain-containing protein [Candidatus Nitrosocaldus sp.]MCS7140926.1 winged helix-turn-helix domain-containing protein [Candidatus Nitrosocaldus sp.]MDW7999854.1 winged helix-turn-helix domain-containing protein [Candidatus Nitrosocaldus sp.]MDW8274784.1 winged helix-turn-helix domain-containing protein [Candidatus Nitrosocaldus sp.]